MQIPSLQARPAARGTVGASTDRSAAAPARQPAPSQSVTPVRGGLRSADPERNRNATAAQRTLAFIDAAQAGLRALKKPLSDAVAGRMLSDSALQTPLRQFGALWQTRVQATDGGLDAQLRVVDAGQAQQAFSIRGLDPQSLDAAGGESLRFALRDRQSATLTLEPEHATGRVAKRLDQVLAPLGVRAGLDEAGGLRFSSAETAWPTVRDGLQVKGSGRLFPTGQFNRVRVEPEPELVRPQEWRVDDPFALRRSLHEVVQLGTRLEAAADAANARLAALAGGSPVLGSEDAAQAAQRFKALAEREGFVALRGLLPATAGVSRERVQALLERSA